MKKSAAFLSLGCKVNSYETEAMRSLFEKAGYDIVDFKDRADVYVVNTCTVTNIADRKSRQMLHQARRRNESAVIAAVGCYAQASEDELIRDSSVDLVVGNNKKSGIVEMVEHFREDRRKSEAVTEVSTQKSYEEMNISSVMEKTRAFIKIQDGCNRFCSYCIIPYVRGRVRSRNEQDILSEIEKLADKGYKEFVLTGIHISSYGTECSEKGDNAEEEKLPLAGLIRRIGEIPGIERIRVGSLEPGIITEEFVTEVAAVKQFCPHFHLSLQSGSDTVLTRMNRRYTPEEFLGKIRLIRKNFDHPAFTTDIIVGFPGETQEEFEETCEFVKNIGFSHIHVFKYSKRAGTKAADMPAQLTEAVKHTRSCRLIAIAGEMSKEYKALFVGRIEKILVEEELVLGGGIYQTGHNERYLKLAVESHEELTNQIILVKVTGSLSEDIMLAEIIH